MKLKFPEKALIDRPLMIRVAKENLRNSFERRKKGKRPSTVTLEVGDKVLLRVRHLSNALDKVTKKFFGLNEGLYIIVERIGQNAFVLNNPNDLSVIGTYNRLNLRKYLE